MKMRYFITAVLALFMFTAGCASEPQSVEVEVTRLVDREVIVEVTQVVTQPVMVEVPVEVEVTRMVEVVVTATSEPEEVVEEEAEATAVAPPTATPTSAPTGTAYTVRSGDTLSIIAARTGASIADIRAANNLTDSSVIIAGQLLLIPGWDGVERVVTAPPTSAAPPPTAAPPPPSGPTGGNLLPNASFEGDWYYAGFNELQIPVGWQVATDEGANNLSPGAGGLFARPEIRVVPSTDLPPAEHGSFIFDGNKTLKAFKGYAPTSFSLFTDIALQPGSYRLTIRFFADTVDRYEGSNKIYSTDPQAAEMRVIHNSGGTGWQGTTSGQRGAVTYDFTVTQAGTVRLGASFRNRWAVANNGWFLDHWELYATGP
jgi:LysM repeat protein